LSYPINEQAEAVQNWTSGTPISLAASIAKLITPSETMHVTRGTSGFEFSLRSKPTNGAKQFFRVESHSFGISCIASRSDGGSPSRMVSNWKSVKLLTDSGPWDLIKCLWLNSVFTKVTWKPREWRSLDSCIMGVIWPCAGNGTQTAWGFFVVSTAAKVPISIFKQLSNTGIGSWRKGVLVESVSMSYLFIIGQRTEYAIVTHFNYVPECLIIYHTPSVLFCLGSRHMIPLVVGSV